MNVVHELGCRLDDALEAHRKEVFRAEGELRAHQNFTKMLPTFAKIVDSDMDSGKYTLEVAKHIKKILERIETALVQQQVLAEYNVKQRAGVVNGLDLAVNETKRFYTNEEAKRNALLEVVSQNAVGQKAISTSAQDTKRPPLSIKMQRQAEELQEQQGTIKAPSSTVEPAKREPSELPKTSTAHSASIQALGKAKGSEQSKVVSKPSTEKPKRKYIKKNASNP